MSWLVNSLQWYFVLFAVGLIFIPFSQKLFGSFIDKGYAFSKTVGIILITYSVFVLGVTRLFPYGWLGIMIVTTVLGYLNWRVRKKNYRITKTIVIEELLFLCSFLFLSFIRSQEPSIHGLEKFMDYGFMQSILKSTYFPPADMWYIPEPINYYYFGHLTGATLIKLTQIPSSIGYNLVLATILGLATSQTFSLVINIVNQASVELKKTISETKQILFGLIGTVLLNFAGNLHTIYLFTKGYPNEKPIEFWKIFSGFNPTTYWYPNATRFIPFTIHEFPSYSYVVADLHGHVFDIPFVLLTIALLFTFFVITKVSIIKYQASGFSQIRDTLYRIRYTALFGFMTAIHYMTNAFDGPIYLLLVFLASYFIFRNLKQAGIFSLLTSGFFILFSLPFTLFFKPFATGVGVNCSPQFLVQLQKIGPFLFEKGNCQPSPLWMMFLLWGQFWISLAVLTWITRQKRSRTDLFMILSLAFSFVLVWIPEFFYAKDIYPAHFRANTMFKLGYQAFILGSIGISYTLFRVSHLKFNLQNTAIRALMCGCLFLVLLYPLFSFQSFYGQMNKSPNLDGIKWLENSHPESAEIVRYLNSHVSKQVNILEAQGDSYTDLNVVSSYTGNPTVAGWWVHEWLWRGSSQIVQDRVPDIITLYESRDIELTKSLLRKYKIDYIVVTTFEREKYPNLYEKKFEQIGRKILNTNDGFGALYSSK
ncbi:MAG: DUF2298 domain-containing protein [Microgenomates group bacterium]|nr:MAG: hypothetical protein IPH70_04525 [Candidatus Roizmanbacteria bacterium]